MANPDRVARVVQHLADVRYSGAERVVLVIDQLNTHTLAPLLTAYPAAADRRIAERIEIHDTPKHGSRFNAYEGEPAVLERRFLRQRFGGRSTLEREVAA